MRLAVHLTLGTLPVTPTRPIISAKFIVRGLERASPGGSVPLTSLKDCQRSRYASIGCEPVNYLGRQQSRSRDAPTRNLGRKERLEESSRAKQRRRHRHVDGNRGEKETQEGRRRGGRNNLSSPRLRGSGAMFIERSRDLRDRETPHAEEKECQQEGRKKEAGSAIPRCYAQ